MRKGRIKKISALLIAFTMMFSTVGYAYVSPARDEFGRIWSTDFSINGGLTPNVQKSTYYGTFKKTNYLTPARLATKGSSAYAPIYVFAKEIANGIKTNTILLNRTITGGTGYTEFGL